MTASSSPKRDMVKTMAGYIRNESWVGPAAAGFALVAGTFFMSSSPISRGSVAGILLIAVQLLCIVVALVSRKWPATLLTLGFMAFSFVRL